jgi:hypothetical protein
VCVLKLWCAVPNFFVPFHLSIRWTDCMAAYRYLYEGLSYAKPSEGALFSTKSLSTPVMISTSFDHPDVLQPGALTSFHYARHKCFQIYVSLVINVI